MAAQQHISRRALFAAGAATTAALAFPAAASPGGTDSKLLMLGEQWMAASAEYNRLLEIEEQTYRQPAHHRDSDAVKAAVEASTRGARAVERIEDAIVAQPATTIEGVRVKAALAKRYMGVHRPGEDYSDDLVWSLIEDLAVAV